MGPMRLIGHLLDKFRNITKQTSRTTSDMYDAHSVLTPVMAPQKPQHIAAPQQTQLLTVSQPRQQPAAPQQTQKPQHLHYTPTLASTAPPLGDLSSADKLAKRPGITIGCPEPTGIAGLEVQRVRADVVKLPQDAITSYWEKPSLLPGGAVFRRYT